MEFKVKVLVKRFSFLSNRVGRGLLMCFIGSIACTEGWTFFYSQYLTLAVGAVDVVVGIVCVSSYCCIQTGEYGDWSQDEQPIRSRTKRSGSSRM